MYQTAEQYLSLSNEAALFVKRSKILYANGAAKRLFGSDCVGQKTGALLGADISGAQTGEFIADVKIGAGRYAVRTAPVDDGYVLFFTPTRIEAPTLDTGMMGAMRDLLMSINVSCTLGRSRAERLGDEELTDCFAGATRSYYMLSRILTNVSVLEGLAEGSFPFQAEALDVSELCQDLVDSVREVSGKVEIRTNLQPGAAVCGDRMLIQQALLNLISNCMSHAAGFSFISVGLLECIDRVVLSVTDDGCGIAPETANSLFIRTDALDGTIKITRGANTGLRLVQAVAHKHSGSVVIESKPGRGTSVRLSISKGQLPTNALREAGEDYKPSRALLYTGLAGCLPQDFFRNTFQD